VRGGEGNPAEACVGRGCVQNNVWVMTATKSNGNIALTFKFMTSVVQLFTAYFGAVNEDSLRSNFVLIYELLDGALPTSSCAAGHPLCALRVCAEGVGAAETLDYGYPQILDPNMLKLYITQKGVKGAEDKVCHAFRHLRSHCCPPHRLTAGWVGVQGKAAKASNVTTMQVTGAVGHRREGIRYKRNEVFLDIIESINLLMSAKGTVLRSDVVGRVMMKCFLSGACEPSRVCAVRV
jgi:AP-2 complex subunit mu-1